MLLPFGSPYFTCIQNMNFVTPEFKLEGPNEKHVAATWNVGNHLHIWGTISALMKWRKHKMALHTKSEILLKQYKGRWNRHWVRMENFTKHIKISNKWKFRNNTEKNQEEVFKNMGWQNRTININKENSKKTVLIHRE